MQFKRTGLWRHPDFLKLWTGETVSVFGDMVGNSALALTAVLVLRANALQIGLMAKRETDIEKFIGG
jgi:formate-dependent nitrite reductase membrane component NrfD